MACNKTLRLSPEDYRRLWHADTPSRAKPRDIEHRIQVSCVRWFRYAYPSYARLLFAIPNGGDRDIRVAQRLKAEGVVAGVADLFLAIGTEVCHGMFIEMKTPQGRQSEKQKEFQRVVEEEGYMYIVCRSLDEFREIVDAYMSSAVE